MTKHVLGTTLVLAFAAIVSFTSPTAQAGEPYSVDPELVEEGYFE